MVVGAGASWAWAWAQGRSRARRCVPPSLCLSSCSTAIPPRPASTGPPRREHSEGLGGDGGLAVNRLGTRRLLRGLTRPDRHQMGEARAPNGALASFVGCHRAGPRLRPSGAGDLEPTLHVLPWQHQQLARAARPGVLNSFDEQMLAPRSRPAGRHLTAPRSTSYGRPRNAGVSRGIETEVTANRSIGPPTVVAPRSGPVHRRPQRMPIAYPHA